MKIVLNKEFGGFGCNVTEQYQDWIYKFESETERTAPELIKFVETHPNDCGDLKVIEIPDESTDWDINEYDGLESVVYVVDGKIYW